MSRSFIPTLGDWSTLNRQDGLLMVGGQLAALECPELWDGCVGAWNYGLNGHPWDYSGRGNHGSKIPTVSNEARGWEFSSSYIDIEAFPALPAGESLTVSAWIRPETGGVEFGAIFGFGQSGNNPVVCCSLDTAEHLDFFIETDTSGQTNPAADGTSVTLGSWQPVSFVFDRNSGVDLATRYLDGAATGLTTSLSSITGQISTNNNIHIGRFPGSNFWYQGAVGEVMVHHRALPASQVRLFAREQGAAYRARLLPRVFPVPAGPVTITLPTAAATWLATAPDTQIQSESPTASATWTATAPTTEIQADLPTAETTWTAYAPDFQIEATLPTASATWSAVEPDIQIQTTLPSAESTWQAQTPTVSKQADFPTADATWQATAPTIQIQSESPTASATWTATAPTTEIQANCPSASATWTAYPYNSEALSVTWDLPVRVDGWVLPARETDFDPLSARLDDYTLPAREDDYTLPDRTDTHTLYREKPE